MADTYDAWAVVVFRGEGGWQVAQLPPGIAEDLDAVVSAVRGQGAGAFALVDVADEFFVVVRVVAGEEQFLLSDAGAALDWDLALQVMDRLDLDLPSDAESLDLHPAGELALFADLGLGALELGAILGDEDAYADELLASLARRLGFADAFEQVVEALV
ncbi:MAG TPA: tRNA adenosine deaminase-associated protein [Mycobacteriales bacterium]|nr:tRNA adenosine deaminase-associated protein [Mycobacteriales bacterium]